MTLKRRGAAIVVALGIAYATPARAQGIPAGRPDFSGTCTLDAHLGDNPEQVAQEIRFDTGRSVDQDFFGGRTERGRPGAIGRGGAGLRYVYEGNVPGEGNENTVCPACRTVLVKRYGVADRQNRIKDGGCPACGTRIAGVDMDGGTVLREP